MVKMLPTRLKTAREKRGLTQPNMADALEVTLRAYQRYEAGERDPSFDSLLIISKTLRISLDWLFGLIDEDPFDE